MRRPLSRLLFQGLGLAAALVLPVLACGNLPMVADEDETHYISPIQPPMSPELLATTGVVANVVTTSSSMASRGELRGVPHADVIGAPTGPQRAGLVTPNATFAFETGDTTATNIDVGKSPGDSNIAVSSTHVCLTARGAFACYTKGGQLVSLGTGTTARPYNAQEFFNLSGILPQVPSQGGNGVKDGRVVFDPFRARFFFLFQTRETPPASRLLIAVSKTQDPRDGFWTYADLPNQLNPDGTPAGQDYDRIGVTSTHFLVSNNMGAAGQIHFMYTAADLASGLPYTRGAWAHTLAQHAGPAVHQSTSTDAFWVNRDDASHVSVWAVRNGQVLRKTAAYLLGSNIGVTASGPISAPQKDDGTVVGGVPDVGFTNIGFDPQNVDFRDGKLTWVANESHVWSGLASANNVARVVRMDVSNYFTTGAIPVEIDRVFGRSSSGDVAGAVFDYGWPAVASNAAGDLVIGTVRTNASIFPQQRASVWLTGDADIESSALIGTGTASNALGQYHMAGASADPTTSGVYLSQMLTVTTLPSGTWWKIRVNKVLGVNMPDILPTQVTAPANVVLDQTFNVSVTVMNQGDATMPASTGKMHISLFDRINPGSDVVIGTFAVPALGVGGVTTIVVPCLVSSRLGNLSGTWTIGPALDRTFVALEHSETNNVNPFDAGFHGNARVTF